MVLNKLQEKEDTFHTNINRQISQTLNIANSLALEIDQQEDQVIHTTILDTSVTQTIKESSETVRSMNSYSYSFWLWMRGKFNYVLDYIRPESEVINSVSNTEIHPLPVITETQVDSNNFPTIKNLDDLKILSLTIGRSLDRQIDTIDGLQESSEKNENIIKKTDYRAKKMSY